MSFSTSLIICMLFGVGFGLFVQRAGLCFAHGLGEVFLGKGKRIVRMFLVIFMITGVGFLLTGYLSSDPDLGLKAIGKLRGHGFYNLLAGVLFGSGIFLNGGCILGTLRQIGEGNLLFLIVFVSFIPGMALVEYVLKPILGSGYADERIILPDLLGFADYMVMGVLVVGAIIWLFAIRSRK